MRNLSERYYPSGKFDRLFDSSEKKLSEEMKKVFANATLVWLTKEMETVAIQEAIKKGSVLFTWCDSDATIRSIMGEPWAKTNKVAQFK